MLISVIFIIEITISIIIWGLVALEDCNRHN